MVRTGLINYFTTQENEQIIQMNQEQRKFLIEQVGLTFKDQSAKIKNEMPKKPSLNNYLVAACLDGSIQLCDVDELKNKIRERVLKFGKNDQLVKERDEWRSSSNDDESVTLDAEDIFIYPKAYVDALNEYNIKKKEIDARLEELDAQKRTIIMKIQIGSNQVLDKLIAQVDNMADLSIMNSQLLLSQ